MWISVVGDHVLLNGWFVYADICIFKVEGRIDVRVNDVVGLNYAFDVMGDEVVEGFYVGTGEAL